MNQRTHLPYLFNILQFTKFTDAFYSLHDNLQADRAYPITPGQKVLNPEMVDGYGLGSNLSSPTYCCVVLGNLTSLCLSFLIDRMTTVVPTSECCYED